MFIFPNILEYISKGMQNSIWNSRYFSPEVVQLFLIVHLSEFFPVDFQRSLWLPQQYHVQRYLPSHAPSWKIIPEIYLNIQFKWGQMVWGLLFQTICDIVDDWKSSTLVHVWKKLGVHKSLICVPRTFWRVLCFLTPWMMSTLVQPLAII